MESHRKQEIREYHHSRRTTAVPSDSHRRRMDSPHQTPLRSHSHMLSDDYDPPFSTPEASPANFPCTAIVSVDKCSLSRPPPPPPPPPPPMAAEVVVAKPPLVVVEETQADTTAVAVAKVGPTIEGDGRWNDGRGRERTVNTILRRSKREDMLKRAALGFRVCEAVLSLISFSVMAADKTQGWSGDSFDRYREYRYCVAVNVIAFAYSGFQAYDMAYHLISGKHLFPHYLRSHFDLFLDQALAYLLVSASSAAATRVGDWQSNWGKDAFTEMASASVGMSFSAFLAFAFSSLISAYNLFTHSLS